MKENIKIKEKFSQALENHKKNNLKIAENYYKEVLEINPQHFEAYNNLGLLYDKTGKYHEAKNCYEKAIEIEPKDSQIHNNLGIIYNQLGEFDMAKKSYIAALNIQPNFAEAHSNLGIHFKQLGQLEDARNCFAKAAKYKPDHFLYLFYLSELKNEILNSNLKNNIIKIIKNKNLKKKNLAFGNYLLARCEREEKNHEKELNYLIEGHFHYFASNKEKYSKEVNYWLNVMPNLNKMIKK